MSNPFRLHLKPAWLSRLVEKVLALDELAAAYERRPIASAPEAQLDTFFHYLETQLHYSLPLNNPEALAQLPRSGPCVFVANHPLGGLEGIVMSQLLRKARPDLKVLTNELLTTIPEFNSLFIGVDVLSPKAHAKNARGVRQAMKHVKQGGALLIYPAGAVSSIQLKRGVIADQPWKPLVGALIQQYQASCVPFFVHGRNSRLFYAAGLIHPLLRTALLPRELARAGANQASLSIGSCIHWQDMQGLANAEEITAYLRTACDLLQHPTQPETPTAPLPPLASMPPSNIKAAQLQSDLSALGAYKLLSHNSFDVYCAPYAKLNGLMDEIAVARERAFRAAGEGTGLAADSDRFDPHYLHLFIWDNNTQQLVGGYRIGETQKIVARYGVAGLYSRSLYNFDADYIGRFSGAVEVGRSFVSPEYQRHPRALDLLWQGIGTWMTQHPQYHTLFGCVSISSEHSTKARAFLSDSLMQNFRAEQEYLSDVRPVAPLRVRGKVWSADVLASLSNITLINKLLGQCDPGKSVPILLRHYLALNGRFIGFSVNHSFNDSLDGLIVVDLRKTPAKYLQRYLGKAGSAAFTKQWRLDHAVA